MTKTLRGFSGVKGTCAALAFLGLGSFASAQESLLYVWDASIPGDAEETKELLKFAKDKKVKILAIGAARVGYQQPSAIEDYTEFVTEAHKKGIAVVALSGYSWFTVSPDAGLPGQPTGHTEGWFVYENVAKSGLFDAILDDSQPYLNNYTQDGVLMNYLWDDTERAAQDYLDYLRGVSELAGKLPFIKTTPLWFDADPRLQNLILDGESVPHSLSWYVARIVDANNVLAYRDDAVSIIQSVQGELALGPCIIGVETQDRSSSLSHITFFEEGREAMDKELKKVKKGLKKDKNFLGFTLHYYRGYSSLDD